MNLSDWTSIIIPALLAVAALWGPGLVITSALRLSWGRRFAFAPLASVAAMGLGAIAGPRTGADWGWPLYLGTSLVLAIIAFVLSLLSKALKTSDPVDLVSDKKERTPDPRSWPVVLGVLITLPFTVGAFIKALGRPEIQHRGVDAKFHAEVTQTILETGNGSALDMGSVVARLSQARAGQSGEQAPALSEPLQTGFFPAGFHDLVTLTLVNNGTADLTVSTNAVVLVLSAILLPLAAAHFAAAIALKSTGVAVFTAILVATYTAYPESPASFGIIGPLALAYALIPLLIVATTDWFGRTSDRPLELRIAFVLILGLIGAGIAHPTSVIVVLVVITVLALSRVLKLLLEKTTPNRNEIAQVITGIASAVLVVLFFAHPTLTAIAESLRNPVTTVEPESFTAVGEAHLSWLSHGDSRIYWVLGILTALGMTMSTFVPQLRWFLATFVLAGYVFAASAIEGVPGSALVRIWYPDPAMSGMIFVLFGALIAGFGSLMVFTFLFQLFHDWQAQNAIQKMLVTILAVGLIVGTNYVNFEASVSKWQHSYRDPAARSKPITWAVGNTDRWGRAPEHVIGTQYAGVEFTHERTDAFRLIAKGGGAATMVAMPLETTLHEIKCPNLGN